MLRRLCSRASRCCRSWPSSARSSSGVRPAKPAGGTGIGGKAGRRYRGQAELPGPQLSTPDIPESGQLTKRWRQRHTHPRRREREAGGRTSLWARYRPRCWGRSTGASSCGGGCSTRPRNGWQMQNGSQSPGLQIRLPPPSCLGMHKAHLYWWVEGPQPLLSLGEAGQVERDPLGATVGTCLEEKEAGGPGGLQRNKQ
jgi:hypothetical protein